MISLSECDVNVIMSTLCFITDSISLRRTWEPLNASTIMFSWTRRLWNIAASETSPPLKNHRLWNITTSTFLLPMFYYSVTHFFGVCEVLWFVASWCDIFGVCVCALAPSQVWWIFTLRRSVWTARLLNPWSVWWICWQPPRHSGSTPRLRS